MRTLRIFRPTRSGRECPCNATCFWKHDGRKLDAKLADHVNQILAGTHTTSVGNESVVEQRLEATFIVQFERQPMDRLLHYLFVGD